MEVLLVTHPSAYDHDTGWGHPERPERIDAAIHGVRTSGLAVVDLVADAIDPATLGLVHEPAYVAAVEEFCRRGGGAFDHDTSVVEASWGAALHSAGAGLTAIEALGGRTEATAFIAMRPPGHHALAATAMGYQSCPMIGFDIEGVAKLINLPEDHVMGAMVAIGKGTKDPWPKPGQLPLSEVVIENRF